MNDSIWEEEVRGGAGLVASATRYQRKANSVSC